MSLVICDVTPGQILFLADSARPLSDRAPRDYPNDATKVLLSSDGQLGIALAGTLNFPWQNQYTSPEKWVEAFLQHATPDELKTPVTLANALKQRIESLRHVPYNDFGVVVVAGFLNGQPEVYELEVRSKSLQLTDLVVSGSQPQVFPRVWSFSPQWNDLLALTGVSEGQIPTQSGPRHECLKKMLESGVAKLRAAGELRVASPIVSTSILKPKIAVLGWGSLVWNPKGDSSAGQKPLLIQGDFQKSELEFGLEYSRVSCDGRLTLVIDSDQKIMSKIHFAESEFNTRDKVIENLREREGMPSAKYIRFVSRGEQHQDNVIKATTNWLGTTDFTAAAWTGLNSNYEDERGEKFTPEHALNYLLSLNGEIRDKAFGYIISAPDSVDTPLRKIARWPEAIAVHEAGHYVVALLLGRKIEEVWIQKPDSNEIKSGCRYVDGDSDKRSLLELILTDLAGPRAQVCYHEKSIQPWKRERFRAAIVYPEAEHHLYSWTGWHTTDLPRACGCFNENLYPLGRGEERVKGRAAIEQIDLHLKVYIARGSVGRTISLVADRLLHCKHINGDSLKALEKEAKAVLEEADYSDVYP